jgi:hypothetical protein
MSLKLLLIPVFALVAAAARADDTSLPAPCEVTPAARSATGASYLTDAHGNFVPVPANEQVSGGSSYYMRTQDSYTSTVIAWSATDHGVISSVLFSTTSAPLAEYLVPTRPGTDDNGVDCGLSPLPAACASAAASVTAQASDRLAALRLLGVCR